MTHRSNFIEWHREPFIFLGPTDQSVSYHSHYLQVKFEQYSTIFYTLLCLSIILAYNALAYLPREFDPIKEANMSDTEINHPISEHKYTMYTSLSHTSQKLLICIYPSGICSCKTGFIVIILCIPIKPKTCFNQLIT